MRTICAIVTTHGDYSAAMRALAQASLDDGLPALELTLKATAGSVEVKTWPGG